MLQEREFERVGGGKTIQVDTRVIATTNRDLIQCVERGEFREDLYYRLNVFPIYSLPLRERKEDILLLAEHFKARLQRKHGVKIAGFSSAAKSSLLLHDWPGNIRELQNTIERAVILNESGNYIEPTNLGLISLDGAELQVEDLVSHNNFANAEFNFWEREANDKPGAESGSV